MPYLPQGKQKVGDTPYIQATKSDLYINTAAADKIGLKLDETYVEKAAEKFDTITAE